MGGGAGVGAGVDTGLEGVMFFAICAAPPQPVRAKDKAINILHFT